MFKLFLLLIGLFTSNCFGQVSVKTYIPEGAKIYGPMILKEQARIFPNVPYPPYILALIEHETCITLKHSRCFNPKARLLTSREEGAGLPQITRTFRKDGTVKMDVLTDYVKRYNKELHDLSWSNVYSRPDLQARFTSLMLRDLYKHYYRIPDTWQRTHFVDSAYNGGPGMLDKERMACGLAAGCNPNIFPHNVERYCLRNKNSIYGTRNACDINRHHVDDVLYVRFPKYRDLFK